MNKAILIGRLTKSPEIRTTADGLNIARYILAVDRMKKGEADFITCVAFGKAADFAEKWLTKGTKIAITGHIQTGSYESKSGKVYTTEIVIESQEFCEKKDPTAQPTEPATDDFMSIPDGADLPFA